MFMVLVCLLLAVPCAFASQTVLVDALPNGGTFVNIARIDVPLKDVSAVEASEVEAGLASVLSSVMTFAEANGVTHVSLLSLAPGSSRSYAIPSASKRLILPEKNPSFLMVLYRGGSEPSAISYSLGKPQPKRTVETISVSKVSVPEGWTTEAWIYFNLPRLQRDAVAAGSKELFLSSSGKGQQIPVIVPGLGEPWMVYSEGTVISASWYSRKK
jgi:hypothetical protein